MIVGTLAAGTRRVQLDNPGLAHRFTIRFSGTPAPVSFKLQIGDRGWKWTASPPARQVALIRPPGVARLEVSAPMHRPVALELASEQPDLGPIDLHRLPVISGRVVDALTHLPLSGARITDSSGDVVATSEENGSFHVVVDGIWPSKLFFTTSRHAPKSVPVPRTMATVDLGSIDLSEGGNIHCVLEGMPSQDGAGWQVRRIMGAGKEEPTREGRIPAGQTEFAVERLDPGEYRLIVRGKEPLQQFAIPVRVREGITAEAICRMHAIDVVIETRLGERPLGNARIDLHHNAGWQAELETDASGARNAELWQRGDLDVVVSRPPEVMAWTAEKSVGNSEEAVHWTLQIADRKVTGRVVDAISREPVAEAVVVLQMNTSEGDGLVARTLTSIDGTFEAGGMVTGTHTMEVMKPGYRPNQKWTFRVGEGDSEIRHPDLLLEPWAGQRTLLVVNERGVPLEGVGVYFAGHRGVREVGLTDATGRATLSLVSADESGVVFVVPRSGSFAFTRIPSSPQANEKEVTVRVPDGTAAIEITTESTEGAPIANVGVLMRVNGMLIPIEVLAGLNRQQGIPFGSDANGRITYPYMPPGQYELWPIAGRDDFRRVYQSAPPPPAAVLRVTSGRQSVALRFRPQ
ncbi:MAG TPA: carboxypeptidase-like regulatory domain-containing protein [Vicinamibacterales bacterium]|nr:carboxypeptidase-like regulatory domain-containing protein [Vicinamibacterales bacterium]